MVKTLSQVREQIAKLQATERKLREAEAVGVVQKMKVAIEFYGFTPEDLFGPKSQSAVPGSPPSARNISTAATPRSKSKSRIGLKAQYSDGAGNEWVGRGARPLWLREALAAGKPLSEFAISRAAKKKATLDANAATNSVGAGAVPAKSSQKRPATVKYRDGDKSWTGRGPMPRWLKAAANNGKKVDDFLV